MLHEITFPSYNNRDMVYAWIYVPACKPLGIIQLVHGGGEHSRRYLHMIAAFVDAGYIVAADDHVGHGKTALENNTWGDWGEGGAKTMVEDEKKLHDIVCEKYPNLPFFMYGHSMGSFVARQYMSYYGKDITGVTLCGTPGTWPGLEDVLSYVRDLIAQGKDKEFDDSIGGRVLGYAFSRVSEPIQYGNEWICEDKYVQDDHALDPFNSLTKPSNNISWLQFLEMVEDISRKEWASEVDQNIKILMLGGDQDPIGQYGSGIYETANKLTETGHNVSTYLYSGYRHEIHNYADIKFDVESRIIEFFDSCITE